MGKRRKKGCNKCARECYSYEYQSNSVYLLSTALDVLLLRAAARIFSYCSIAIFAPPETRVGKSNKPGEGIGSLVLRKDGHDRRVSAWMKSRGRPQFGNLGRVRSARHTPHGLTPQSDLSSVTAAAASRVALGSAPLALRCPNPSHAHFRFLFIARSPLSSSALLAKVTCCRSLYSNFAHSLHTLVSCSARNQNIQRPSLPNIHLPVRAT
jgi:hypothetical protein